jgi:hypothetical protein
MQSLCENLGSFDLRHRGASTRQLDDICLVYDAGHHKKFARATYSSVMFLVPLAETGLQDLIDIDADAPDGPLVDLHLV